jgi:sugar lactone lactonase YvrE
MKTNTYKDLIVFQKAYNLALDVYKATKFFPEAEKYGLVSQLRKYAVSMLYATRYTLYAILLSFILACAPQYRANLDLSMENMILWPGPPEKPRIRYLWSLNSLMPEGSSVLDILAGEYEFFDIKSAPMLLKPMYVYKRADILYIADAGAARVTVINLKTMEVFHVGIDGKGELTFPVCVVSDRDGNIYVSDSTLQKVYKYDPKGNFIRSILSEGSRPVGLAYDNNSDTLYIADTRNHTVHAVDRDGAARFIIGRRGDGDGEFNYPTYLWVDSEGRLYVSDTLNSRIQIFDAGGKFVFKFGMRGDTYQELSSPKGVAVDTHGDIYVVDSRQDMVKIYNRDGRLLLFFGDGGIEYGKFNLPNGMFIDKDNTLYVADTYNMRIQTFQLIE